MKQEASRYYIRGVTEPRNISKAVGALAVATLAVSTACGGGGSAENPTQTDTNPDAIPGNTLVVTATPFETPEVTPIPTPEPTPEKTYSPEEFSTAVGEVYKRMGLDLANDEIMLLNLDHCTGKTIPEGAGPNFIINSCGQDVGANMRNLRDQASDPETRAYIQERLDLMEAYTYGLVDHFELIGEYSSQEAETARALIGATGWFSK